MRPATLMAAAALASSAGCAIDFVATEEPAPGSWIDVVAHHDDSLHVDVDILHAGDFAPTVSVAGDERFGGSPDPEGRHRFHFAFVADPLDPVLDVRIHQVPNTPLDLTIPLLTRVGPATCSADGDLLLPASSGSWQIERGSTSYRLELAGGGHEATVIIARSELPDPLRISGSLVPDSAAVAHLLVTSRGTLERGLYPVAFSVSSGARWTIPNPC